MDGPYKKHRGLVCCEGRDRNCDRQEIQQQLLELYETAIRATL